MIGTPHLQAGNDAVELMSQMPRMYKWDFTSVNPSGVVFDFEAQSLVVAGLSRRRLIDSYSATITNDVVRHGRAAVRFELRPGDRVSDGWRAELRDINNAKPNSEVWYALSTLVPEDFPEDDNSYVLIQWHDQKVPWNNPKGHSPPLALRYHLGSIRLTLRHAFSGQRDGENGRELVLFEQDDFAKGVWHDFVYHIRWSAHPAPASANKTESNLKRVGAGMRSGVVRAWLDNRKIVDYSGPIGYFDDLGPYVKFGIYARNNVGGARVVYHDEYRRGLTLEQVCQLCDAGAIKTTLGETH